MQMPCLLNPTEYLTACKLPKKIISINSSYPKRGYDMLDYITIKSGIQHAEAYPPKKKP